jgi:hypothetical protein
LVGLALRREKSSRNYELFIQPMTSNPPFKGGDLKSRLEVVCLSFFHYVHWALEGERFARNLLTFQRLPSERKKERQTGLEGRSLRSVKVGNARFAIKVYFVHLLSKRAFVSNFYNRPEGEGVRATFAKVANQLPSRDNRRLQTGHQARRATNVFFFSFVMAGR